MKKINKILLACMILFSFSFLAVGASAIKKEPVMYSIVGNGPGGGGTIPPEQPPQVIPWGITRVNAIPAAAAVDESSVIVAILDTGMDLDHPDLATLYVWGYDVVNQDTLPDDDHGHGSHCAGTIAGLDNEIGVVGVAPDVGL